RRTGHRQGDTRLMQFVNRVPRRKHDRLRVAAALSLERNADRTGVVPGGRLQARPQLRPAGALSVLPRPPAPAISKALAECWRFARGADLLLHAAPGSAPTANLVLFQQVRPQTPARGKTPRPQRP